MDDFSAWKTDKETDWVDENWQDYVTDEESRTAERDARQVALRKITNRFHFTEWLNTAFKELLYFLTAYELEPSYGWAGNDHVYGEKPAGAGYSSGFKNTAQQLANYLSRTLKEKVVINGTGYAFWNLTHDTSIKDSEGRSDEEDQDGYGVEIVSPALRPSIALEQLALVLDVLGKYDIETNESTGIHVNISLENLESFDPLKLVLFMGDEHILKKFDRTANTFTNSQIRRVVDSISASGKVPKSVDELIALGREGLKETGKYFSVNLTHLPKYLEFRAAGGADYHKRLHDIREVMGRWLTAVEIAAKPDMYRNEYLKKVIKLFDKTSEGQTQQEVSALTFTEYLRKNDRMFLDTIDAAKNSTDQEQKVMACLALMLELGSKLDSLGTIPFSWMKEVRSLFTSMDVSAKDVLDAAHEGKALTRVTVALRAFKLIK